MLPGALQAQPEGGANPPSGAAGAAPAKPKSAGLKPPAVETILGRDLARDGSAGVIAVRATPDKGIEITKLSLPGEGTSFPPEPCVVDLAGAGPIQARISGRPNGGALRYEIDLPACPFSLEVLDGAILVTRNPATCEFKEAQCRADPAGLWGPKGDSFSPEQAKQFERERSRAEADMRVNFRALLAGTGKDKDAVKKIAAEQAGFSSVREMTCRSYLKEDVHGYCALRLTQARALALQAAFSGLDENKVDMKPAKAKAKRKPAAHQKQDAGTNQGPEPGFEPAATPQ